MRERERVVVPPPVYVVVGIVAVRGVVLRLPRVVLLPAAPADVVVLLLNLCK